MRYYDLEGIWARPLSMMRPHLFNYGIFFKIPRMVTSPKLVSLGVGAPLHPFLRKVIEMYKLAPIRLSPNSYKLVLTLFILYHDLEFPTPTMNEVSHFFSLRKSNHGYYYLVVDKQHTKKVSQREKSVISKDGKNPFLSL